MTGRRTVAVEVVDAVLTVELIGSSGPAVVCWPAGGRPGADLVPFATAVARTGFQVALIDPRGCERSPGRTRGLTLGQLAQDAAAVIETLDAAPAFVVGHAFGNRVMRCLAADRPELVAGVVVLAAGGAVPPENLDDLAAVGDPSSSPEQRREAVRRAFFEPTSDPDLWLQSSGPGATEMYRTCILAPLEHWWPAGDAPLLVVQGGRDRSAPPANGRLLADEHGPRVRLVTIPEAAHALPMERPAEVADHVVDWLYEQRGAR